MAFSLEEAAGYLTKARRNNRLGHAYLITGPEGSGKRELVRRLCSLVLDANGTAMPDPFAHPDVSVAEPESKSRRIVIDQVRQLERVLRMKASGGGLKVGVLFDADRMQVQASNAFLKTLEEPPAQSLLLLVTAHPELLLETILSRCIEVPLRSAGRVPPGELELELIRALAGFFKSKQHGVAEAFGLVQDFFSLLGRAREGIEEEYDAEMKREEQTYAKATDGSWLEGRETHYKALGESRYVLARSRLVETLFEWWADVLRIKQGCGSPALPEAETVTRQAAERFSVRELLDKIKALETLRDQLDRNVQEQLALEVTFLRVFSTAKKE